MLTQNPIATDVRKSIPSQYVPGLENIVAARSRLSHVEGDVGRLTIAGFPLEEIAPHATFEEIVHAARLAGGLDRVDFGGAPAYATRVDAAGRYAGRCA